MININRYGTPKQGTSMKYVYGGGNSSTSSTVYYGGTVYIEKYGSNFTTALKEALKQNEDFTVFDCTFFSGNITVSDTIVLDKPCTILLGNASYTCYGKNFFHIKSNNVQIIGYGRETDRTVDYPNTTKLYLTDNAISNESTEGYHIYSKGNKNIRVEYLSLYGKRTTLGRQCGNESYPIDGYGGIYIEKENPVETYGGNTCNNTIINQLLIDGTKAHGIYLSTGILCMLSNIRCSQVAGHGIFLNGGTSITLDNCYMASANCAGFCLLGITYCTLLNCVAEYCGTAFLTRGAFNVSMFSPGCEQSMNQGNNPWGNSSTVTGVNGFNIKATGYAQDSNGEYTIPTTVRINDVSSDLGGVFSGTPFVIVGGRGISLYTPYCIGIAQRRGNAGDTMYNRNTTALLRIIGNARKINVTNAQGQQMNGADEIYNDIKIESNSEGSPNGVDLVYDPTQPLITSPFTDYVTDKAATYAPIYCVPTAQNISVRNGSTFYYKTTFAKNLITKEVDCEVINSNLIDMGYIKIRKEDSTIAIVENVDKEIETEIPVTLGSIGTNTGEVNDNANYCHTDMIDYKEGMAFTIAPTGDERGYTSLLYIYEKNGDGSYTFTKQTIDLGRTNITKDTTLINQNLAEGASFMVRFYTSYENVKFYVTEVRSDLFDRVKIDKDGIKINGSDVAFISDIPTKVSAFQNDRGYITKEDLDGGSNITKVSELENDLGFVTESQLKENRENLLEELVDYVDDIEGSLNGRISRKADGALDVTSLIYEKGATINGYTFEDLAKRTLYCIRTGTSDCWHTVMLMKSSKYYYMWFDYNQGTTWQKRVIQLEMTDADKLVITHIKNFKIELFTDSNLE